MRMLATVRSWFCKHVHFHYYAEFGSQHDDVFAGLADLSAKASGRRKTMAVQENGPGVPGRHPTCMQELCR